ncbi:MAG: ParB/RepB/Spo0J family partition protein [Candidatus Omnitrophota bacterium]
MDRKVLGRGLDALIPAAQDMTSSKDRVVMLPVDQIIASRYQPRTTFSQEKIYELANSIREKGVISPVLVRLTESGQYELIAGERRWRAVKQIGISEIPAIVRRIADADLLETSIIENIQREELNAIEEAKAYQRLATDFGYTQDQIAQKVGKDKTSISNLFRVLNLPAQVLEFVSNNMITLGHAKALLTLQDQVAQIAFCKNILDNHLSVRQAEMAVSKNARRFKARRVGQDAHIAALEERLQHRLGTKVKVVHGKKRGKIVMEYYSLNDLDRLLNLLGVPAESPTA